MTPLPEATPLAAAALPLYRLSAGFYDPTESELPEEGIVDVQDATDLCNERLHTELDAGVFTLWPLLTKALEALARDIATSGPPDEGETRHWERACESGALLFLRSLLLEHRVALGVPLFDWPVESTPRYCRRYGEAHATFMHPEVTSQASMES